MPKTIAVTTRVLFACALLAFAWVPRPAIADDDTLTVIGASNTAGFFEVIDHVAVGAGFYKAEHLNVQKQYIASAAATAQLVASGKADIASCAFDPIWQGYEKGLRLQFFFQSDPQYVYVLGVLDNSPIRSLADFKGTDIGETTAGSASEVGARSLLGGAGLARSDYAFVPIGSGAAALAAIESKKVAGVAVPGAELSLEAAAGNVKFRIFRHPILKNIGTYGFAATPATIAAKPDQLRRFSRALVKAALLIRENPQLAARYFVEGSGQPLTDQAVENEVKVLAMSQGDLAGADPSNPKIGYMSPRDMGVYSKFFSDNGLTGVFVPPSAVVTNQFIAFANDFDRKTFIAQAKLMK
jgi:NitT/TauT family transport system substrate-binding protein